MRFFFAIIFSIAFLYNEQGCLMKTILQLIITQNGIDTESGYFQLVKPYIC